MTFFVLCCPSTAIHLSADLTVYRLFIGSFRRRVRCFAWFPDVCSIVVLLFLLLNGIVMGHCVPTDAYGRGRKHVMSMNNDALLSTGWPTLF